MSRKKFIESNGATCKNWSWSWSFINEKEKIIIFGAWDHHDVGDMTMVFSHDWEYDDFNRKKAAYPQSREHIKLIEEKDYTLKTFIIYHSEENKNEEGLGPAKIKGFKPELEDKLLVRIGNHYYATAKLELHSIVEEVTEPEKYLEGTSKRISINTYERNPKARRKCIEHYGYECQICFFNFEEVYGTIGKDYIHVHHRIPLSEVKEGYEVDPVKHLIPLCPNCHAIIHRTKPALRVEDLKNIYDNKI